MSTYASTTSYDNGNENENESQMKNKKNIKKIK